MSRAVAIVSTFGKGTRPDGSSWDAPTYVEPVKL